MKLKTNKSAAKRIVGKTAGGKIRVRHTSAQHLATNKSKRVRKTASLSYTLNKSDAKRFKRLTPYL